MITIGTRELKNRLGRYLRQVQAGETILVTRRGCPVAELRPVSPAALGLDARLRELAADGLIRWPIRQKSPAIRRVKLPGSSHSQTIVEDRKDRF